MLSRVLVLFECWWRETVLNLISMYSAIFFWILLFGSFRCGLWILFRWTRETLKAKKRKVGMIEVSLITMTCAFWIVHWDHFNIFVAIDKFSSHLQTLPTSEIPQLFVLYRVTVNKFMRFWINMVNMAAFREMFVASSLG